jgi:hypothetical protein
VPTVDFKSVQCKVRWQAAKLERTGHVRCATGLSGAPTSQRAPTVNRSKTQRCADVARTGQWTVPCPVHHRTVRCAHRQQKQPTARKWLEAINTPQPPPSMASKFSELHIHCKSKRLHSKTQSIDQILSKPPNQLNSLVTWERVFCVLLLLGLLSPSPSYFSKCLVKLARDT